MVKYILVILILIFMAVTVWGLLEKSQTDPEKIEEAIARLIAEHNANEEAHLGAGQSLQSHKAAEIIDHLVASIIADKLADLSVSVRTLNYDKFYVHFQFATTDCLEVYGDGELQPKLGQGSLLVGDTAGWHVGVIGYLSPTLEFNKNPVIQYIATAMMNTNQVIYLGSGAVEPTYGCFWGFKIVNAALYACHGKNTQEFTTDISAGIDITQRHIYKAVYTYQQKIEFYVDGVLKATHTENLPDSANPMLANRAYFMYLKTTADEEKEVRIHDLFFIKDL